MIKIKTYIIVLIIPFILLFLSCDKPNLFGEISTDEQLLQSLYSLSNDTLLIDNQKLVLETELYRNFFPGGIIPRDTRLVALIYVRNIDSLAISDKFSISKLYLINNDQIWISDPADPRNSSLSEFKISKISTDGPEWETGTYVDVIIKIENSLNSQISYLIAKEQLIIRIE